MENLSNISVIRDVLSRHGFSFSKGLGQNFLINPTVCPRMAEMGNAQPGWGMMLSQPPIQYILGGHRATWGTLTLRDRAARKPAGPITTRRPVVQIHLPRFFLHYSFSV